MMNRKGSVLVFGLMVGITIVILAMALAPAVSEQVLGARNNTWSENISVVVSNGTFGSYVTNGTITHVGLDCGNDSISDFDKATCHATDLSLFYFIGALILMGGAVVGARFLGRT